MLELPVEFITKYFVEVIVPSTRGNIIQGVLTFRDFWFQRVFMKCEDHEFRGLFLV